MRQNSLGTGRLRSALLAVGAGTLAAWAAMTAYDAPARIFLADTLPVTPTVVQVLRTGSRDLTPWLTPPCNGRWEALNAAENRPYCVRPAVDGTGAYSSYPAGMEFFAWPVVAWGSVTGRNLSDDWTLMWLEARSAAIAGAGCVVLFFLCALRLGPPGAAWLASAFFAAGSVVASTLSQWLWQQTGVVFWMLFMLWLELRHSPTPRSESERNSPQQAGPGRSVTVLQGLAASLMLACRPSAATFLLPFGVWVAIRSPRRCLWLAAAAGVGYLPWAVMYLRTYGTPFGPSMAFLEQHWTPGQNVLGVLFSPGRGVFIYQPWLLLVVLLAFRSIRRDASRPLPSGWYLFCLATMALHTLLVGSWGVWWGGYCWGSRLASEVVAVMGLLVVRPLGWLMRRWWGWAVLAAVAFPSVWLHRCYTHGDGAGWNVAVDVDRHPERQWDWRHPPFLYQPER